MEIQYTEGQNMSNLDNDQRLDIPFNKMFGSNKVGREKSEGV